jgi:hypothetical protein
LEILENDPCPYKRVSWLERADLVGQVCGSSPHGPTISLIHRHFAMAFLYILQSDTTHRFYIGSTDDLRACRVIRPRMTALRPGAIVISRDKRLKKRAADHIRSFEKIANQQKSVRVEVDPEKLEYEYARTNLVERASFRKGRSNKTRFEKT